MNNQEMQNLYSRAIIAGILDFPALMEDPVINGLDKTDFFGDFGTVWEKMVSLAGTGALSTVNLVASLSPASGLDLPYFVNLRREFADLPTDDLADYARALRKHSARRSLLDVASRLANAAHTDENPQMVAGWAMDALAYWAMDGAPTDEPIADVLSQVYEEAQKRYADPRDVWGIPYGFPKLDKATGGLQKGELLLVGGEPGVGKTWWATQLVMQAAQTAPGAFLTLEMRKQDIVRRMMSILGVERRRLMTGRLEVADWQAIDKAMDIIQRLPIVIDDRPLKLNQVRATLARHKTQRNIQWFVLDYLMLIDAPGKNEIETTQQISREMKLICKDLDLAGIVLHSVNKMGMDSDGTAKSKLRGSGQVVHDADLIYMLTKFKAVQSDAFDMSIMPARQDRIITLHIEKGRELERSGGVVHYERRSGTPGFDELDPDKTRKWDAPQ